MASYTIGQVAERSGFSASALRYYETHGLVAPVGRTEAGYRIYDDRSLERLRFIARAKELGCTLEEIVDLAALWEAEDCAPVQARLHELVTAKIADAERRRTELLHFTAQLQAAAAHLGAEPADGPCAAGCACLDGGARNGEAVPVALGHRAGTEIACTLPSDEMPGRMEEWQRLLGFVTAREPIPDDAGGVRLTLRLDVPVDELTRLIAAEQACCSFFAFAITVDDRGIALEVRAPGAAAELVAALFGVAP